MKSLLLSPFSLKMVFIEHVRALVTMSLMVTPSFFERAFISLKSITFEEQTFRFPDKSFLFLEFVIKLESGLENMVSYAILKMFIGLISLMISASYHLASLDFTK